MCYLGNMIEKFVRFRIPEHLYKRYRVICIKKDLSMPKQTAELIRQFVENLEQEVRVKEQTLWNAKNHSKQID